MFRDDEEALRGRIRAMEADLARERGRGQSEEARRRQLEDEVAVLRRELDRLRPEPRPGGRPVVAVVVAVAVLLVVGLAGVAFLFLAAGEAEAPGPEVLEASPPAEPPLAVTAAPRTAVAAPTATGLVRVRSTPPGLRISANGSEIGMTPLEVRLPPGRHEIRMETRPGLWVPHQVEVPEGDHVEVMLNVNVQ